MRSKFAPRRRDLHFLDAEGMVACNPRDREAAHRAQAEGIASENPGAVTCQKCLTAMKRAGLRIKRDHYGAMERGEEQ